MTRFISVFYGSFIDLILFSFHYPRGFELASPKCLLLSPINWQLNTPTHILTLDILCPALLGVQVWGNKSDKRVGRGCKNKGANGETKSLFLACSEPTRVPTTLWGRGHFSLASGTTTAILGALLLPWLSKWVVWSLNRLKAFVEWNLITGFDNSRL